MAELELPAAAIEAITGPASDAALVVLNRDPAPGEVGVPTTSTVALEIAALGGHIIDSAELRVFVGGVLALDGASAAPQQVGFDGPRSRLDADAHEARVVLDPAVPLASEERVEVRVVARSTTGHLLEETYAFVVEDRTAPRLLAAVATGPTTVRLGFDEAVRVSDGVRVDLRAIDGPAVVPAVLAVHGDGTTVLVELDTPMSPRRSYAVSVAAVTDLFGNPVAPPFDRVSLTGWTPLSPSGRRFDLWSMLPKHNRRRDERHELERFVRCLQEIVEVLLAQIDRMPDGWSVEHASPEVLRAILADLGSPIALDLGEHERRRLAASLVDMYRLKGTAKGIKNAVRFFLALEIDIAPYTSTALVLGESELGVDWELGPSDRYARYAFDVRVPRALSPRERRLVRELVEYLKPAHTHFVQLLEPEVPIEPDHWELDLSELDHTTILH